MRTLIDFDAAPVFAIPFGDGSSRRGFREGMLIEGPQGWGEFSPPRDSGDDEAQRWLTAAVEVGTVGWPDAVRGRVPVAVHVSAVDPSAAHRVVSESGCLTADVAVGGPLVDDIARLESVRDALGPTGNIRCEANGMWDVDGAVSAIEALNRAAGGLEYVAHPCRDRADQAAVRRRVDVPIAGEPNQIGATDDADIAVLEVGALGGVRRALRVAETLGIPVVVSSAMATTIGLSAGLALAGALPELPLACALGSRSLLEGDVVAGARSLVAVDGFLPVAPMPPAPDAELTARYAATDEDTVEWWQDRLRRLTAPTLGGPAPTWPRGS